MHTPFIRELKLTEEKKIELTQSKIDTLLWDTSLIDFWGGAGLQKSDKMFLLTHFK